MKCKNGVTIPLSTLYSKEEVEKIGRLGTLVGLDQATNSGIAILTDGEIYTYRLSMQPKRAFKNELSELVDFVCRYNPTFIAHEIPTGRFYPAIVKSSKILGGFELHCGRNEIGLIGYTASEIKKFATGKGNSNKAVMLHAAQQIDEGFDNDDEADAFFILRKLIQDLLKQN